MYQRINSRRATLFVWVIVVLLILRAGMLLAEVL